MDFSVPGSDEWESTPTQDHFIESYLHRKEESFSGTAQNKKRKLLNSCHATEIQQTCKKSKSSKELLLTDSNQHQVLKRKARKQKRKGKKVLDSGKRNSSSVSQPLNLKPVKKHELEKKSLSDSTEENVSQESSIVIPQALNPKSSPKLKKLQLDQKIKLKSLKPSECPTGVKYIYPISNHKTKKPMVTKHNKNKSKDNDDSESESENSSSILEYKKTNILKKLKKKKNIQPEEPFEKTNQDDWESQRFQIEESTPSPKKNKILVTNKTMNKKFLKNVEDSESHNDNLKSIGKLQKTNLSKNLKNKASLKSMKYLKNSSEDDLHEASDDEKIVSDIKNSSIFKDIQKLMKEAPFLHNLQDSDDSVGEISGSYSESDASESGLVKNKDDEQYQKGLSNIGQNKSPVKSIIEPSKQENKFNIQTSSKTNFPRGVKSCDFPRNIPEKKSECVSIRDGLGKINAKLQGAKFRYLNEKLYTETGATAFEYFQENKEEFDDYHKGYSLQVSKWPMNPVDKILSDLEDMEGAVIADMGCGDAKIARTLHNCTVHSFDIVALNEHVTPCNISKVPLAKESVDIVVFCLSLMGTNLKEYLLEAHRILKMGGRIKIAEVESRIEDVDAFISKLKFLGFSLKKKDLKHRMFVFLDFQKVKKKVKKDKIPSLALKPCLYKKR